MVGRGDLILAESTIMRSEAIDTITRLHGSTVNTQRGCRMVNQDSVLRNTPDMNTINPHLSLTATPHNHHMRG
ncbi:hypothetical protein VTH8203_03363 [Vibrio thalassae]|uniref:Uncharacterized protein n=1 Tax=Vibrio thalassae TaxID=1243014 RepID=A0A240ENY2_9VIBR|nr:hypothetical protein VTH8203_03363 [Vibrio thalassae]